ncbi:lysostaphin resistance A-like protein [Pseudooctadecabacter sp.]|uniref:CPBP family intramembrane glutamic endopeptidase n=1 Tax=Pseudooctadecabacter sp. TaxID=1966338 RepID=UPI0035C7DC04
MSLPNRYAPMAQRAAPFEASANWAFVGISLFVLYYGFALLVTPVLTVWAYSPRIVDNPDMADAFYSGSTPLAVRWNLALFAVYAALLWGILRLLHRVALGALVGQPATALYAGVKVAVYLIPLYIVALGPSLSDPTVYQQMDVATWLAILPLTLPLLLVQIGAEELVFRGYLQSHMAALSRNPLVWMVIPSVLFGLIHYDGTQPPYSTWAYVVWAMGLGLVCADVTARHGTLGPAIAIHFINNFFAMFVLAADDWLYGASLYVWPTGGLPWDPWVPFETLFLLSVWLATRLAIRR